MLTDLSPVYLLTERTLLWRQIKIFGCCVIFLVGLGHDVHLTYEFKALCQPSKGVNQMLPIRVYRNLDSCLL